MLIGERIKLIREIRGLTQAELCQKLGWHKSSLSRIEQDKVQPRKSTIRKISNALNVSYSQLIGVDNLSHENRKILKDIPAEEIPYSLKTEPQKIFEENLIEADEYDLLLHTIENIDKYFKDFSYNRKKIFEIFEEVYRGKLQSKNFTIKKISEKIGLPESLMIDFINKIEKDGSLNTIDFILILNKNNISIFDFLEFNKSDDPNFFAYSIRFLRSEIQALLSNLFLKPNDYYYDIDSKISIASFKELSNMPNCLYEIISDDKMVSLMNIQPYEILRLFRLSRIFNIDFSKQDYLDMLYFYRKAQKQSNAENKEGE